MGLGMKVPVNFEGGPDPQGEHAGYTTEEIACMLQMIDSKSHEVVRLNEECQEMREIIRDALKVLHKTNVSKKKIADRMREAIGLLPGEKVHDRWTA
jgi:hypothetical protein